MKARKTQAQKLALVLKHGTFATLTKEEAMKKHHAESIYGFPFYVFVPFNQKDPIASELIQASANPFVVIDNIIDLYELS